MAFTAPSSPAALGGRASCPMLLSHFAPLQDDFVYEEMHHCVDEASNTSKVCPCCAGCSTDVLVLRSEDERT